MLRSPLKWVSLGSSRLIPVESWPDEISALTKESKEQMIHWGGEEMELADPWGVPPNHSSNHLSHGGLGDPP